MFCPSWVRKSVRTVVHPLTVGPSNITACVLLWENPGWLSVYLLLAHGTRRHSHHKVVSRPTPTSDNGIPNGASFDTAVTIDLRLALLNVKCFSDFSLPPTTCTIYCLHALPIDFMWHRSVTDIIGNGWLGACPSLIASQCSFFAHIAHVKFRPHIHQSMFKFYISWSTQRWWSTLLGVATPQLNRDGSVEWSAI